MQQIEQVEIWLLPYDSKTGNHSTFPSISGPPRVFNQRCWREIAEIDSKNEGHNPESGKA
jgi:hypothetical protein